MLKPATWNRWIVGTWLLGFAAVRAGSPREADPYWQIRAGLENLDGVPWARPDSWSWAPVDGLFYPNSPGWNVVLGLAWRAAGFWGLFLVTFAVLAAYLGLAYLIARRLGARPLPALAGLTVAIMLGFPMLSGRAAIAAQGVLLLALAAPAWWRPRAASVGPLANGAVALGAGAALSASGNWLHLSWLTLAPAAAAAWAVYWLALAPDLAPARGTGRRLALIAGGALGLLAGTLASPYGVAVGIERTLATQRACQGLILEWVSPFTPGAGLQWVIIAVALLAIAAGVTTWLVRRLIAGARGERFALVATLSFVGVPAALGGLLAIRFLGVSALLLAPVMAWSATLLADRARSAALRLADDHPFAATARRWTGGDAWRRVLTAVAVLLLPGMILLGPVNHARPSAAAALATLPSECRLFSTDNTGGVAVLLRPDVPVWIDTRADYYGRERLLAANAYLNGRAPTAVPPGTTCVVLPAPEGSAEPSPVAARVQAESGWDYRGRIHGFDVWLRANAPR